MGAVSIRAIAERIEYSPRTIYLYFEDKEAILDAVRGRGFQALAETLTAAERADYAPVPAEASRLRLRRLGLAYLDFASGRRNLFSLMYLRMPRAFCAPVDALDEASAAQAPSFAVLMRSVAAYLRHARPAGNAEPEATQKALAFSLWGMVHGLASLELFGQEKEFVDVDVRREYGRAFDFLFPIIEE